MAPLLSPSDWSRQGTTTRPQDARTSATELPWSRCHPALPRAPACSRMLLATKTPRQGEPTGASAHPESAQGDDELVQLVERLVDCIHASRGFEGFLRRIEV